MERRSSGFSSTVPAGSGASSAGASGVFCFSVMIFLLTKGPDEQGFVPDGLPFAPVLPSPILDGADLLHSVGRW